MGLPRAGLGCICDGAALHDGAPETRHLRVCIAPMQLSNPVERRRGWERLWDGLTTGETLE